MKIIEFDGKSHQFPDDFTDADIAAALGGGPSVSTMSDVGTGAARGLVNGVAGIAGLPADAGNAAVAGLNYLSDGAGDVAKKIFQASPMGLAGRAMLGSRDIQRGIETATGPIAEPTGTAGKYAKSIAEWLPGMAIPGGGLAFRGASAVLGGIGSEFADQASGGDPYAKLAGGMAGALSPSVAARAITPIATSAERARLLDILADEGVTSLTAGQRTGNKALQYAESILGDAPLAGQGASRIQHEGQRQFTEAALRRAGAGGQAATPEVLAANYTRLGDEFRNLSARNDLIPDQQFVTDVVASVRNYARVPPSQQRAMVEGYVDDIVQHVNTGQMPGPHYQEMRSRLSRQAKSLQQTDPTLSDALRDLRNSLDDAMGRSISPADQQAWQTARLQWGAQKDIEKTASRAGEATAEGQIVPTNLRNVAAVNNRGAYARGEGQFSELARAGAGVMAPLPNSGTAQRAAISALVSALGGGAGFAGGGIGPGLLAGAAAPTIAGRALMSRPVQSYLGNTAINLENLPPARRALLRALLGQERPAIEAR